MEVHNPIESTILKELLAQFCGNSGNASEGNFWNGSGGTVAMILKELLNRLWANIADDSARTLESVLGRLWQWF